jgi:hypothetical protein
VSQRREESQKIQMRTYSNEDFVIDYLKQDGVYFLRIVKKNTNDFIVGELISALWKNYEIKYLKINV